MARLFTSFEEAWDDFLTRDTLDSFFDQFPAEPDAELEGWLIVPPLEIKRGVLPLQALLEDVGLVVVPHHFLHVWILVGDGPEIDALAEQGSFEIEYSRVNVLNTAVVIEARADAFGTIDAPFFLPHMTIAVAEGAPRAAPIRDVVVPLREVRIGVGTVDDVVRIRAPGGRTTVLQPWTVIERRSLQR